MKKRTKESKKRLQSLILLIAFTAIMLIVSTYAWFSTQKDVMIANLQGEVKVAEGLEISFDGKQWSQKIDLGAPNFDLIKNSYTGNTNIKPTEMLPVSTCAAANGKTLNMYSGILNDGEKLTNISLVAEPTTNSAEEQKVNRGFYAFDIFLKNTTAGTAKSDALKLNKNSTASVKKVAEGGKNETGLENTIRVGFALYEGGVEPTSNQKEIIDGTKDKTIISTSIWEPNDNSHIQYIVDNYGGIGGKYPELSLSKSIKTFAIKGTGTIENIFNKDDILLEEQKTVKTKKVETIQGKDRIFGIGENPVDLKTVQDMQKNFEIPANKICKVRVYVWLEGQDIDCVNYASHGGGIEVNVGLEKTGTQV